MPFLTAQQVNLLACSLHTASLMLSVKQGSMKTQFQALGLTGLGIKPESTVTETDALSTWQSGLLLQR